MKEGFITLKADSSNLAKIVYLQGDKVGEQLSVVNKLNSEYSLKSGNVLDIYNEYQFDSKQCVVRIERFMKRTQVLQSTYLNYKGEKVTKKDYLKGYVFHFIRLFRGCYEFTDVIDKYTIGYAVVSKNDITTFYGKKIMTSGLTHKADDFMQNRLDNLNSNYKISY